MARERLNLTVDGELLASARGLRGWANDASMLIAALRALVADHRATQIDASYKAYDDRPLSEVDEWGDPESFREAAGSS
jgi:hypothetical protein